MAYDSLRPYLDVLEQQGKMRWVDKEVDKDWEIGAIARMMFCALPEADRCGLGFRNIKGFPNGRVVAGVVASSHELMATALQCDPDPEKIRTRIIEGLNEPIEPVVIDTGPCKEVILRSDEVDLQDFPIPVWTPEKDAGPYLTPLWVTKDPDTGQRNIGIRRCQIKGRDRTTILFGAPDGGGAIQFAKWRARGEHMPAAIFMGTDPVHYLVAPARYGTDELAIAGGIRGEPIELVKDQHAIRRKLTDYRCCFIGRHWLILGQHVEHVDCFNISAFYQPCGSPRCRELKPLEASTEGRIKSVSLSTVDPPNQGDLLKVLFNDVC